MSYMDFLGNVAMTVGVIGLVAMISSLLYLLYLAVTEEY